MSTHSGNMPKAVIENQRANDASKKRYRSPDERSPKRSRKEDSGGRDRDTRRERDYDKRRFPFLTILDRIIKLYKACIQKILNGYFIIEIWKMY